MSNNKYFSKSRYPLDLTKKFSRDLQYEDEGYQYGGNILPFNTFSEYDKMYPEGGQIKPIMADLGYPNNIPDSPYGQYNDWEIGDYEQILNNKESQIGNIFGKQGGASLESAGKNSANPTKSSKISSGVNTGMNMLSTALGTFAPPDSKLGKAMNKGNQFAQVAEPLGMLDMVVPGLGTGLVQGAKLVGALYGGFQAKNEEVDVNRMKDINKFNAKYNNQNYDKLSGGNFLAKYGITTKDDTSSLEQEIFQDFDMFLQKKK